MSGPDGEAGEEAGDGDRRCRAGDLELEIDTGLCVGFGDCVDVAPDAFELDGDELAAFTSPATVDREKLLEACRACPVDAIVARGPDGEQLAP